MTRAHFSQKHLGRIHPELSIWICVNASFVPLPCIRVGGSTGYCNDLGDCFDLDWPIDGDRHRDLPFEPHHYCPLPVAPRHHATPNVVGQCPTRPNVGQARMGRSVTALNHHIGYGVLKAWAGRCPESPRLKTHGLGGTPTGCPLYCGVGPATLTSARRLLRQACSMPYARITMTEAATAEQRAADES